MSSPGGGWLPPREQGRSHNVFSAPVAAVTLSHFCNIPLVTRVGPVQCGRGLHRTVWVPSQRLPTRGESHQKEVPELQPTFVSPKPTEPLSVSTRHPCGFVFVTVHQVSSMCQGTHKPVQQRGGDF